MSIFSSHKKIFLLGFILAILVAIPLTVFVAQQRQQTITKADKSTTLSFEPASPTVEVGQTLELGIVLDPTGGTDTSLSPNQVSFVKLTINFDPAKFEILSDPETPSLEEFTGQQATENTLTSVLEDAIYESGKATISLSIGVDPTRVVTQKTKIATLKLKALGTTTPGAPSQVTLNTANGETQVLSIAGTDETSENVLSSAESAEVTINSSSTVIEPTSTPTSTPSVTPTIVSSAPDLGESPVCSALNLDRSATGNAPYSLTFTAVGNDSDGTISKVSFNFGDGPVQTATTGGGIGTNTINTQISHTYNNPGIYTAYVILTDNQDNLSEQTTDCTKTITINQASVGGVTDTGAGSTPDSPVAQDPPTTITLPPTGPGETIIGIGIIGTVITILGAALFLLL